MLMKLIQFWKVQTFLNERGRPEVPEAAFKISQTSQSYTRKNSKSKIAKYK